MDVGFVFFILCFSVGVVAGKDIKIFRWNNTRYGVGACVGEREFKTVGRRRCGGKINIRESAETSFVVAVCSTIGAIVSENGKERGWVGYLHGLVVSFVVGPMLDGCKFCVFSGVRIFT